jgi:eukaryotic-like serine/threonine-protein kinase
MAVGGMGSIHFGVLTGAAEFSRLVAIKRLHPQLAEDPLFRVRFIEEARLNARVLHPNVVQLLDVVEAEGELWLVMEYVDGETLHCLQSEVSAAGRLLPLDVVAGVVGGVLEGLHAAHETSDAAGAPLRIVHRDVSPQNIMISRSGQVKVIDFGIAKATAPTAVSTLGRLVGKVSYMSPEQATGAAVDQRSDVFAAGVVLWETLTGKRLFRQGKQSHASILRDVLRKPVPAPSAYRKEIPSALDAVVLRALARNPNDRFGSAREFAQALQAAIPVAPGSKISAYVTVFCEPRAALRGPLHGLPPAQAPPSPGAVTHVPSDHEEPTSLALTGVSEPHHHIASRKLWLRRLGRYALPLAVVLCSTAAIPWARLHRSIAERPTEAGASASVPLAHGVAPDRPTASFGAAQPHLAPQPAAATALVEVPPIATRPDLTKQRTPRPRGARSSGSKPTAARKPAASAEPLLAESDDCSSPTYLGQDGIQHFKVQCL